MKKTIALMISLLLAMSTATTAYGAGYSDVKIDNWAYEAVNAMSNKTIIKGYPNGSFKPNNTVTYGEFIKMALIAGTGEDVGNAATGNWATNYYSKALELKYYTTHDIDQSQLGNQITRGDMALIISAVLGEVTIENYDEIQKGITDVNYQTEHEYDITKAYATGILTGYTDNTFKPDKTLTRAESAMVIYRLVYESKRELPGGEKEEVTTPVDIKIGDKTFALNSTDVQLGYNGIEKIQINSKTGDINVYSTVCYDAISVCIDNVLVSAVGFTSGLRYDYVDGYYIYVADPTIKNINTNNKIPSLTFTGDSGNIYRYIDVTL